MPGSHIKKVFKRREHSVARWGGIPMDLPKGVDPTPELLQQRKDYLQSLLPEHLKEGYVKPVKPVPEEAKVRRHRDPNREHTPRSKAQLQKDLAAKAKNRAKTKGLPFNITADDIPIPDVCPVFGVPLVSSSKITDNTPSIDRLVPELGYTKGNVVVISLKANRLKGHGTTEELERLLLWMKEQGL